MSYHLIEEATVPAAALGGLKFGKNAATIDGSLIIEVSHEGAARIQRLRLIDQKEAIGKKQPQ